MAPGGPPPGGLAPGGLAPGGVASGYRTAPGAAGTRAAARGLTAGVALRREPARQGRSRGMVTGSRASTAVSVAMANTMSLGRTSGSETTVTEDSGAHRDMISTACREEEPMFRSRREQGWRAAA